MSSSSTSVQLSHKAYVKLMLHACKHHGTSVNGILLGSSKTAGGEGFTVEDVVPLFHTATLAPMLEVAMDMIEKDCESRKLSMVGVYFGNELLIDHSVSAVSARICSRLRATVEPSACLVQVHNEALSDADRTDGLLVHAYNTKAGSWDESMATAKEAACEGKSRAALTEILKTGAFRRCGSNAVVDFDDFLDDPSLEWLRDTLSVEA